MLWEAYATLFVLVLMAFALIRNISADVVMVGSLTILCTLSIFSDGHLPNAQMAAENLGSHGLVTIAVMFVVAEGLKQTGALPLLTRRLLGRPETLIGAQNRLLWPVAILSAFLNNNPIVAMFMPVVNDWSRKCRLSPSKLLIPLSYAAILGGTCTLIGTSTNIYVQGEVIKYFGDQKSAPAIDLFTVSWLGFPAMVVGLIYIFLFSRKGLPDRQAAREQLENAPRYTVEMTVDMDGAIHLKSIEDAGLRHLENSYLAEIERDGERLVAPGPETLLHGGDRLIFVGVVDEVVELQKIRGLSAATDQVFKLDQPRPNRRLVEAVISPTSPMIGKTVREGRFRSRYDAVIIAVARGGEHLYQKIGDIKLQAGDTILMETHPSFIDKQRNRSDFYLASTVEDSRPIEHERAWFTLALLAGIILAVTFNIMSLLNAGLLAVGLMIVTGCLTANEARNSIDWRILMTMAAAMGIGTAMNMSGAAGAVADLLFTPIENPYVLLAVFYFFTMALNMTVGHVGAASIAFQIAMVLTAKMDLNPMPFIMSLMMAASADFANPVSYPTHLMVYGPGGYRMIDYMKFGLPLNFLVMFTTVSIAPMIWPFS